LAARHNVKELAFELDGMSVPLTIRRNKQARRMIVRIDPKTDGVKLTLPWYVAESEGLSFLNSQTTWLRRRLGKLTPRIAFADGVEIEILDETYRVQSRPDAKRGVWIEDGAIHVSGRPEHMVRRLTDWLKAEAKKKLSALSDEKAAQIGKTVKRVTVRDTTSRWGSCTHDGALNYSWRLIMAPSFVFDFIVAHEVAHLIERNHGPNFHLLVDQLTDEAERAEAWLSVHGAKLHRIG
jgi:predicted metal-dependent hydrolase